MPNDENQAGEEFDLMGGNLLKITELLNDGEYHDGTSLGDRLNITRAAVWKSIKKLQQYGIRLTSVKGKGYLLEKPLVLLNPKKIKSRLNNSSIQMDILEKIKSTSDYLRDFIFQNKKIRICAAEMQTRGKGRLNRQWHSPFGQNIYLSMLYPFQKDISELSGLSLVTGLAICRVLQSVPSLKESVCLKWPNDIIVNQHKIAGTLIEIQAGSNGSCQVIIGIGINVNMQEADKTQIDQHWSSLQKLTGQYQDRNFLCAELINRVLEYLDRFIHSGLTGFLEEWKQNDCLIGKPVALVSGKFKFNGIGAGINTHGHLLLGMEDGTVQAFSSGDTTLLKSI